MKTIITFKGQEKPLILDNIQVAQQRVPMYVVTQGDTRYRFRLDDIEKVVEEGVMSDPADVVSADETDSEEPQGSDAPEPKAPTSIKSKVSGVKGIEGYITRLAGAFADMPEKIGKKEIAERIQEKLGVKPAMSYRIERLLEQAGKIKQSKYAKEGLVIVDPVLDPIWVEGYEAEKNDPDTPFKGTLEEYVAKVVKEDCV